MHDAFEWPSFEQLPLSANRDMLTTGFHSPQIAQAVRSILRKVRAGAQGLAPLRDLQRVLDGVRVLPPSIERVRGMNSLVRTLGEPHNLAVLLELLWASLADGGRTGYPAAEWDVAIHIWRPNIRPEGFRPTKRVEPDVIVGSPHSHPFSFVAYVSKGLIHQSTYTTSDSAPTDVVVAGECPNRRRTLEERVRLEEGDSYFQPSNAIHDVEVSRQRSIRRPAVMLFLRDEAAAEPKPYPTLAMAGFRCLNPDLKEVAVARGPRQWADKLRRVTRYLRVDSAELRLDDVATCDSTDGFLHV